MDFFTRENFCVLESPEKKGGMGVGGVFERTWRFWEDMGGYGRIWGVPGYLGNFGTGYFASTCGSGSPKRPGTVWTKCQGGAKVILKFYGKKLSTICPQSCPGA